MRVLIVTLIFPPDGVSTAQLLGEIAEDLASSGHSVSVVTTTPHYNHDQAAVDRQPLVQTSVPWLRRSEFGDVEVTHIAMADKARGRLARTAQWAWFHLVSAALIWRRRRETDVIFTVSPPLTVATVCGALRRLTHTPFVFGVWEMYPDILVRLGSLDEGLVYDALKRLERNAYRSADRTALLSSQMLEAAQASEPSAASRFRVVPTFVDCQVIRPADRRTSLRSEVGFGDQFVVGYAGNIGRAQNIDILLDAAAALRDSQIRFLVCGDGSERKRLEQRAVDEGLDNVVFTGHLPFDLVPEIYATADISLVSLDDAVGAEALPSKVYRIMASGRPILGIARHGSPLDDVISTHKAGKRFEANELDALVGFLGRCADGDVDLASMGRAARKAAVEFFDRGVVVSQYEQLLREAAR